MRECSDGLHFRQQLCAWMGDNLPLLASGSQETLPYTPLGGDVVVDSWSDYVDEMSHGQDELRRDMPPQTIRPVTSQGCWFDTVALRATATMIQGKLGYERRLVIYRGVQVQGGGVVLKPLEHCVIASLEGGSTYTSGATPLPDDISLVFNGGDTEQMTHFDVLRIDPGTWAADDLGDWAVRVTGVAGSANANVIRAAFSASVGSVRALKELTPGDLYSLLGAWEGDGRAEAGRAVLGARDAMYW